jgi:hypothetical protein
LNVLPGQGKEFKKNDKLGILWMLEVNSYKQNKTS